MNNQLKKGISEIIILEFLKQENYGYIISEYINRFIEMKMSSIYAILTRLEQKGLLSVRIDMQGKKTIKYYNTTPLGSEYLENLYSQWNEINQFILYTKELNQTKEHHNE